MNTQVRHITDFMHQWAPPGIKMSYDNVGLLVGDPSTSVSRVLVCLDVTEDVVDEALEKNVNLLFRTIPSFLKKFRESTLQMNRAGLFTR